MYYDPFLAAAAANADPNYRLQVRLDIHLKWLFFYSSAG